ncbi:MAG: hypothetical protein ITG00_04160 [Flavobacterium sp.]|nr:hypothetical protein [Flavobacterium sp.]
MKKTVLLYCISVLYFSCASIHFKENYLEEEEDLVIRGNVEHVTCYTINEKTKKDSTKIIIHYNKKGKPSKQIDFYKTGKETTVFNYDSKNQLTSHHSDQPDKWVVNYSYDSKGNVSNYINTYDGDISSEIKYRYDKHNNKIEEIHKRKEKPADTTLFENYYKKRMRVAKYLKSGRQAIIYYDKKGNVVRKETQYGTLLYEYDNMGRLSKKTALNKDGILRFEYSFLNTYDDQQNLIETSAVENGKVYKRNLYLVKYR